MDRIKRRKNDAEIAGDRHQYIYSALLNNGFSEKDSLRLAPFLTAQSIQETGWTEPKDNNFGGYLTKHGGTRLTYESPEAFFDAHVKNLMQKWPSFSKSQNIKEYLNAIHSGKYDYAPRHLDGNEDYDSKITSVYHNLPRRFSIYKNQTVQQTPFVDPVYENAFQNWYKDLAIQKGFDLNPDSPEHGYDWRSYFENKTPVQEFESYMPDGHFPDTYKLPNHETFSNESIYANSLRPGGNWEYPKIPSADLTPKLKRK